MPGKIELSLLIDYYSAFLTENQRELLELSCEDDLSLSEIAEQKGISRQGVRDAIARGTKTLSEMESKLHLIERDRRINQDIKRIVSSLDRLESVSGLNETALKTLGEIHSVLSQLSDTTEGKDGI